MKLGGSVAEVNNGQLGVIVLPTSTAGGCCRGADCEAEVRRDQ